VGEPVGVNWSAPLNKGLFRWYPMREEHGMNMRDIVKGENSDKQTDFIGAPTKAPGPNGGMSWLMDGTNDRIRMWDNVDAPDFQHAHITVSTWTTCNATGTFDMLACYTDSSAEGYRIWQDGTNLKFGIQTWNTNNATAATIADGEWHHVVGTYDGATCRIYVDGIEGTSASDAGPITYTSMDFPHIGGGSGWTAWDGKIADVRFQSRALTAREVRELYTESRNGYPNLLRRANETIPAVNQLSDPTLSNPTESSITDTTATISVTTDTTE